MLAPVAMEELISQLYTKKVPPRSLDAWTLEALRFILDDRSFMLMPEI
jgi:hypothetical protein